MLFGMIRAISFELEVSDSRENAAHGGRSYRSTESTILDTRLAEKLMYFECDAKDLVDAVDVEGGSSYSHIIIDNCRELNTSIEVLVAFMFRSVNTVMCLCRKFEVMRVRSFKNIKNETPIVSIALLPPFTYILNWFDD